ncbi:GAP family protein [Rhodococcus electrodiphilus]|uniref:GAP family protein n=1 Tax=Rhodococcus ruber TaxID=1830 RepID=UPI0026F461F8|nr:GAP family protein [Rhodococcus ruber]MDO2380229.1 GAP family protein [Rhodococcus ruber]
MAGAIGQSLPIAVGLLLAAMPIVMLSVLLVTKRPLRVSYAFVGGWFAGLLVVGAVVIAVADVIMLSDEPTWWAAAAKLVLGVVLVLLAVRKWYSRPQPGEESTVPGWMAAAQTMTARRALALGFLFAAANPKNLALVAAGAVVIADATARVPEQIVALIVFAVVASLGWLPRPRCVACSPTVPTGRSRPPTSG